MSDPIITLAGRYRLTRQIGNGGMADVYLGEDTRLHRSIAVKILRSDLARDANFQERFRREAQSAAGLNHPAIVAVYDTGEEHKQDALGNEITLPYIVMEYVKGKTLREYIDPEQPMEYSHVSSIMGSLLSALQYSHEAGIIHRDIKPGNVMITPKGSVKVMDFGIARAVADATSKMTQTQAVMGTAQYLSPEQARGQVVDARSDIYSAACVMYEMLTGRPPFIGDSPVSIAYQHVREQPVPPSRFNPAIGPDLDAVILTGLAKDREERYHTASDFAKDISAISRGEKPALVAASSANMDPEATAAMAPIAGDATQVLPQQQEPATEVLGRHHLAATGVGTTAGATGKRALHPSREAQPGAVATASPAELEPEKKKKSPWPIILLVLLALLALGAALFWFLRPTSDPAPETIAVPDVVGMQEAEARDALTAEGLTPQFTQAASDEVEEGAVISTDPPAGTEVEPSSTVAVTVSAGPDAVAVPDLSGMTEDEAKAALEEAGLVYSFGGQEDTEGIEEGIVTRSEPTSGVSVDAGSEVTVWLASGQVVVPSVRDLAVDDATQMLTDLGFTVETRTRPDRDNPIGLVLEQTPAAQTRADAGSTVSLIVAGEAGPEVVPNLTGQTFEQAQQTLGDAGFGIRQVQEESAEVPEGSVIRTEPGANSEVAAGSTITVVVSSGPPPEPSPSEPPADQTDPPANGEGSGGAPTRPVPGGPGNNNGNR